MKKILVLTLGATMLLSSCDTYTGAGAYTGAQFGSILGSAIGGISGGHRGSDIGTIIGMAGGAMIGGAIGNAADQKAHAEMVEHREVVKQRRAQRNQRMQKHDDGYQYSQDSYGTSDGAYSMQGSGFDSSNSGDDRIDLDGDDNSSKYEYQQPASPADMVTTNTMPKIEIRNARFIDSNGDNVISRGEICKVVFEVFNYGTQAVYNVVPTVADMSGNKHVYLSQSIRVEKIAAGKGVRYTAMVKADNRLKDGSIKLCCSVLQNGKTVSKVSEFNIQTRK